MTNKEKHYEVLTKIWERGDNFGILKKDGRVISCHDSTNHTNCSLCKFNTILGNSSCRERRKDWLDFNVNEKKSVRAIAQEELQKCLSIHCADCPYWTHGERAIDCQARKISDAILDAFDNNLLLREDKL